MARLNKKAEISNFIKIIIVILVIVLVILVGYFVFNNPFKKENNNSGLVNIVLVNPMASIVLANTKDGNVNQTAVIEEGVIKFNETYINYLLIALGANSLHKSAIGYGNPKIEMILDSEVWSSELGDVFITGKGNSDDPDIRIIMKKEDAVKALMSNDVKQYMKTSVSNGKIGIEMISGKVELYSKGYLDMYKSLSGKDAEI